MAPLDLCNAQLVQIHINTENMSCCAIKKNINFLFLHFLSECDNVLDPLPLTRKLTYHYECWIAILALGLFLKKCQRKSHTQMIFWVRGHSESDTNQETENIIHVPSDFLVFTIFLLHLPLSLWVSLYKNPTLSYLLKITLQYESDKILHIKG